MQALWPEPAEHPWAFPGQHTRTLHLCPMRQHFAVRQNRSKCRSSGLHFTPLSPPWIAEESPPAAWPHVTIEFLLNLRAIASCESPHVIFHRIKQCPAVTSPRLWRTTRKGFQCARQRYIYLKHRSVSNQRKGTPTYAFQDISSQIAQL